MIRSAGLVLTHTLLDLRGVTLHPANDGAWVDADAALGHEVNQIPVADAVPAVQAHAKQDDLGRKAATLEQGHQDGFSTSRPSLNRQG
jgi:hypothetical protein